MYLILPPVKSVCAAGVLLTHEEVDTTDRLRSLPNHLMPETARQADTLHQVVLVKIMSFKAPFIYPWACVNYLKMINGHVLMYYNNIP